MIQTNVGCTKVTIDFNKYREGDYIYLMDDSEVIVIDTIDNKGIAKVTSLTETRITSLGDNKLAHSSTFIDLSNTNHINCSVSERLYVNKLRQ